MSPIPSRTCAQCLAALLLSLTIIACGGDDDGESTTTVGGEEPTAPLPSAPEKAGAEDAVSSTGEFCGEAQGQLTEMAAGLQSPDADVLQESLKDLADELGRLSGTASSEISDDVGLASGLYQQYAAAIEGLDTHAEVQSASERFFSDEISETHLAANEALVTYIEKNWG